MQASGRVIKSPAWHGNPGHSCPFSSARAARCINIGLRTSVRLRNATFSGSAYSTIARGSSPWSEPILISGAGIAGLATALALSKVGVPVRVLESGPGLRQEGAALSLWGNAWQALDALGVGPQLREKSLLLARVELCSSGGQLLRRFSLSECDVGPREAETRGVMRATLLEALYDSLPDKESVVTFGAAVQEVLPPQSGSSGGYRVGVRLSDGRTVYGSALVGADGVGSAVAGHLQLPSPRYAGYAAYRGVAEFPEGHFMSGTGPGSIPLDTIRQIWGAGVRAGIYPIDSTKYYWYTCFNADEEVASRPQPDPEQRQRGALEAIQGWSWEMAEVIRRTPPEDISWGRISDRWTSGAFGKGLVTLAGDAAHPMTPNLGQGGGTALEDAVVLARKIAGLREAAAGGAPRPEDIAAVLRSYEMERSRRCLPLTVRSNLMGWALQIAFPPVCLVRNLFVQTVFQPSHFLDHTHFDCETL